MEALEGEDIVAFADAARWESWLADHHGRKTGVWVKIAKKGSSEASVTLAEALDVALCYGWIDSQRKAHDQDHYLQRYSSRRPNSPWSRVNVGKAEALIAAGRMREPGLAAILAAKADGRWDAAYGRSATPRPARSSSRTGRAANPEPCYRASEYGNRACCSEAGRDLLSA